MALASVDTFIPLGLPVDLGDLGVEARRLWHDEPVADLGRRQELRTELADLDLTIERLSRRASWSGLDAGDLEELDDCLCRLETLRAHWRPAA